LITFVTVDNPAAIGIESFARPGGNVTGFALDPERGLFGKRLELLGEAVPGFSRIGIVVNPEEAIADGTMAALPAAARGLGLDARVIGVRSAAELEGAFATAIRDGMQALYVSSNPVFLHRRVEIVTMVASMRMAAIYPFREYAQSGGLVSYGADLPDMYRRAAGYVDKILKGEKPGELPLQSAEKFELVVNLKAAKALGLTISEAFLLRADDIIE
jgi:putative ABC transport system substrate-binding protein